MNKIILAAAAFAALGLSAAHADARDPSERAAFNRTVEEQAPLGTNAPAYQGGMQGQIVEGRNATEMQDGTAGAEPYISNQIALDSRGNK